MSPARNALWLALVATAVACGSRSELRRSEPIATGGAAGSAGAPCIDADGDGHAAAICGGDDCDDGNASIHPGAPDPIEGAGSWTRETIAFGAGAGLSPDIALGPSGELWVVFGDKPSASCLDERVLWGSNATGAFVFQELSKASAGQGPEIAVGDDGVPRTVFTTACDVGNGLAWGTVGDFGPQTEKFPGVGGTVALSLDAAGGTHGAVPSSKGLLHVFGGSFAWQTEVIDGASSSFYFPSLAVDAAGALHVAYHLSQGELRYARRGPNGWASEVVDSDGYPGRYASLDLGADGSVHVAHHAEDAGELRYARRTPDGWASEVVAGGGVGAGSVLELGPQGEPHVVFGKSGYVTGARYARKVGSTWQIEVLDPDGDYAHPTLAVDGAGVVHVLWHSAQGLEYARRTPDAGIDQDCDGQDG